MERWYKWVIIVGIFLGLIIFVTITSEITPTWTSAYGKESVSPVSIDVNRAGETITLTNKGGSIEPVSKIIVEINGTGVGSLDVNKGSILVIDQVPCPAEIDITSIDKSGRQNQYKIYDEKVCTNDIANIDIWAKGEKIDVVNSGCPRCSNVTKFVVSVGENQKDLGIRTGDNVSFDSSDCVTYVKVTAYLKSGEKRPIVYRYIEWCKYEGKERSFWGVTIQPTPTPVGWCAMEGQAILQQGQPTSCCEGLKADGGYPSGVPGGLWRCKR